MTFRSKIDAWIAVLGVAAALSSIGALIYIAVTESSLLALAVSPLLLAGLLPVWLLGGTSYVLNETQLRVKCGPLKWLVPLAEIRAVTHTRNPLSSPALSLDRLRIDYGRWKSIMISPSDKERFLHELELRRSRLYDATHSRV